MNELIDAKLPEIVALCRRLGVHRLDLFGSATTANFDAATSSSIRNPYFRQSVMSTRELLYGRDPRAYLWDANQALGAHREFRRWQDPRRLPRGGDPALRGPQGAPGLLGSAGER